MRLTVLCILSFIIFPSLFSNTVRGKSFLCNEKKNKIATPIIFKSGADGDKRPQLGDIIYYQLILKNYKDTVIFDTHKEFGVQQLSIEKSGFKGDLNEQLCLLHKGDSALILISCDSLYGQYMPQFAKHNKKMKFYVSLIDFMSKEMWEHKSKQEYQAQAIQDSIVLENYLKLKNRKAQITEKGLMYNISKSGNNNKVLSGDTVWVNYTGRLLDGTIFDSNTDARYGHPEPFKFVVGKGNVIKGWDQGLVLFNEESEGQLYIPSGLAYGKRSSGPIPSNSCLIFDISIVQLKHEVNR